MEGTAQKQLGFTKGNKWEWKKGQSGNPGGRPKNISISGTIREILLENPKKKNLLIDKLLELAIKGDLSAIKEVIDRVDGKAIQMNLTDITSKGRPLSLLSALNDVRSDDSPLQIEGPDQTN